MSSGPDKPDRPERPDCLISGPCSGGQKPIKSKHAFDDEIADVTCDCGFGYYKPNGVWVGGDRVRAGLAPRKPEIWSIAEIEAGRNVFDANYHN